MPQGTRSRTLDELPSRPRSDREGSGARQSRRPPRSCERPPFEPEHPIARQPVDRAARELLGNLAKGQRPDPMLKRLLLDALENEDRSDRPGDPTAAVSDAARSVSEWIGASARERGDALADLLLAGRCAAAATPPREDRLPPSRTGALVTAPDRLFPARQLGTAARREGGRDPPAARGREDPSRHRRSSRPRLLRRAARDRSTSTSTSSSPPSAGQRCATPSSRSASTPSARPRGARARRSGAALVGTQRRSTSSSPTTRFHEEMSQTVPAGAIRRDDAPDPLSRAPRRLQGNVRPPQGLARHRADPRRHRSDSTWPRSKPGSERMVGQRRPAHRQARGDQGAAVARERQPQPAPRPRRRRRSCSSFSTRPAGIESSPASSLASGSRFSAPVTSQRIWRAASSAG